jgi:hypothetical protein
MRVPLAFTKHFEGLAKFTYKHFVTASSRSRLGKPTESTTLTEPQPLGRGKREEGSVLNYRILQVPHFEIQSAIDRVEARLARLMWYVFDTKSMRNGAASGQSFFGQSSATMLRGVACALSPTRWFGSWPGNWISPLWTCSLSTISEVNRNRPFCRKRLGHSACRRSPLGRGISLKRVTRRSARPACAVQSQRRITRYSICWSKILWSTGNLPIDLPTSGHVSPECLITRKCGMRLSHRRTEEARQ